MDAITYKGFTIIEDQDYPQSQAQFLFYPSDHSGPEHDYDYSNESYHYCGNCVWADSIDEAKDLIDEKVEMEGAK